MYLILYLVLYLVFALFAFGFCSFCIWLLLFLNLFFAFYIWFLFFLHLCFAFLASGFALHLVFTLSNLMKLNLRFVGVMNHL
jgi:hypothetical protein